MKSWEQRQRELESEETKLREAAGDQAAAVAVAAIRQAARSYGDVRLAIDIAEKVLAELRQLVQERGGAAT